jgi:UDP-glucose 4-epimerase
VLESIRDNQTFTCNGQAYPTPDGTCIRDYVHVEDIAEAHVIALDSMFQWVFIILAQKLVQVTLEVIRCAESVTGKQVDVAYGPARAGDPATLTASSDRFREVSGWFPRFSLEHMVRHVWQWYTK